MPKDKNGKKIVPPPDPNAKESAWTTFSNAFIRPVLTFDSKPRKEEGTRFAAAVEVFATARRRTSHRRRTRPRPSPAPGLLLTSGGQRGRARAPSPPRPHPAPPALAWRHERRVRARRRHPARAGRGRLRRKTHRPAPHPPQPRSHGLCRPRHLLAPPLRLPRALVPQASRAESKPKTAFKDVVQQAMSMNAKEIKESLGSDALENALKDSGLNLKESNVEDKVDEVRPLRARIHPAPAARRRSGDTRLRPPASVQMRMQLPMYSAGQLRKILEENEGDLEKAVRVAEEVEAGQVPTRWHGSARPRHGPNGGADAPSGLRGAGVPAFGLAPLTFPSGRRRAPAARRWRCSERCAHARRRAGRWEMR